MKRDPDLIREILLKVEQSTEPLSLDDLNFSNYSPNEVYYHGNLLIEVGYLVGRSQYDEGQSRFLLIRRLTWQGHDFIEAARSETVWKKAKEKMLPLGNFVFELAKPILIEFIKQQLGIS